MILLYGSEMFLRGGLVKNHRVVKLNMCCDWVMKFEVSLTSDGRTQDEKNIGLQGSRNDTNIITQLIMNSVKFLSHQLVP